jgi:hypothetical protein
MLLAALALGEPQRGTPSGPLGQATAQADIDGTQHFSSALQIIAAR